MNSARILIVVFLCVLAASACGAEQSEPVSKEYMVSGAFLFHQCEAVSLKKPNTNESVRSMLCMAYIEGYTTASHTICASISYGEMAAVYVAYMRKHPEVMKMNKDVGLSIALTEAYPCHNSQ